MCVCVMVNPFHHKTAHTKRQNFSVGTDPWTIADRFTLFNSGGQKRVASRQGGTGRPRPLQSVERGCNKKREVVTESAGRAKVLSSTLVF